MAIAMPNLGDHVPPRPAAVKVRLDTIEDHARIRKPAFPSDMQGKLEVIRRPGDRDSRLTANEMDADARAEVLTCTGGGELRHVRPAPRATSGWEDEIIPLQKGREDTRDLSKDIDFLRGAYFGRDMHALAYVFSPQPGVRDVWPMTYTDRYSPGRWSWQPWESLEGSVYNVLTAVRQSDVFVAADGEPMFYGITRNLHPQAFFIVYRAGESWRASTDGSIGTDNDISYRLLPGANPDQLTVMGIKGREIRLKTARFAGTGDDRELLIDEDWRVTRRLDVGHLSARRIIPLPSQGSGDGFLVLTEQDQLYLVNGHDTEQPHVRHLNAPVLAPDGKPYDRPVEITSVAVGITRDGRITVYAAAKTTNALYALIQTTGDFAQGESFPDLWSPIGMRFAAFGCPREMTEGTELFGIAIDQQDGGAASVAAPEIALRHLTRDREAAVWHNNPVHVDAGEAGEPVTWTANQVQMLFTDTQGRPCSGATVWLQTTAPQVAVVDGVSTFTNPEKFVRARLDATGRLTVSLRALGLASPDLVVYLDEGRTELRRITPNQAMIRRLNGGDPRRAVTKTTLVDAGLIPPDANEEFKQYAFKGIQDIAGKLAQQARIEDRRNAPADRSPFLVGLAPRRRARDRCLVVDFGAPDGPRCNTISVAEFDKRSAAANADAHPLLRYDADGVAGGEKLLGADWFSQLIGDAINWVKHQWDKVSSIAVKIIQTGVELLVTAADRVKSLIVKTAHAIGGALESFFVTVANAVRSAARKVSEIVDKLIDFVKALFGWEDIVSTNRFIVGHARQLLVDTRDVLRDFAAPYIDRTLTRLQTDIDTGLQTVEAWLDKNLPTGITADGIEQSWQAQDRTGRRGQESRALKQQQEVNAAQCSFVMDKVNAFGAAGFDRITAPHREDIWTNDFHEFAERLKASVDKNLIGQAKAILDQLKVVDSPQALLKHGIIAIIKAIRGALAFVIGFARDLAILAVQLIARGLDGLVKVLDLEVYIIGLSEAYRAASGGSKLTLLDLLTLPIAAVGTIIYKLLNGLRAPFPRQRIAVADQGPSAIKVSVAVCEIQHRFDWRADDITMDWVALFFKVARAKLDAFRDQVRQLIVQTRPIDRILRALAAIWRYFIGTRTLQLKHVATAAGGPETSSWFTVLDWGAKGVALLLESLNYLISGLEAIDGLLDKYLKGGGTAKPGLPVPLGAISFACTAFFVIVALIVFVVGRLSTFSVATYVEFVLEFILGMAVVGFFLAYTIGILVERKARVDEVLRRSVAVISHIPTLLSFIPPAVFLSQGGTAGLSWAAMLVILGADEACPLVGGLLTLAAVIIEGTAGNPATAAA
jgi:hypothetical protein